MNSEQQQTRPFEKKKNFNGKKPYFKKNVKKKLDGIVQEQSSTTTKKNPPGPFEKKKNFDKTKNVNASCSGKKGKPQRTKELLETSFQYEKETKQFGDFFRHLNGEAAAKTLVVLIGQLYYTKEELLAKNRTPFWVSKVELEEMIQVRLEEILSSFKSEGKIVDMSDEDLLSVHMSSFSRTVTKKTLIVETLDKVIIAILCAISDNMAKAESKYGFLKGHLIKLSMDVVMMLRGCVEINIDFDGSQINTDDPFSKEDDAVHEGIVKLIKNGLISMNKNDALTFIATIRSDILFHGKDKESMTCPEAKTNLFSYIFYLILDIVLRITYNIYALSLTGHIKTNLDIAASKPVMTRIITLLYFVLGKIIKMIRGSVAFAENPDVLAIEFLQDALVKRVVLPESKDKKTKNACPADWAV